MGRMRRPRRLTISPLIARDLHLMGAREQHRRQMVTMLILAHLLLAIAVAVGYVVPQPTIATIGATVAVVLMYLVVALVSLVFRRLAVAIYLLIFGNAAIVTALIGVMAFAGQPFTVAQLALLYLVVVCEAGLLFTPEIVLILSGATSTLSAATLLYAISLAPPSSSGQTYLLVVFTLTLQALVGLLAWYAADFIAETIQEVRRASQQEYAQTRLDALLAQNQRQQQELDLSVAAIQSAIARTLAQEPNVRVEADQARLTDLARSINLMLQRVDEAHRVAQEQARMLAATRSVADAVGRLADGSAATPGAIPATPLTYTPIDNISIAAGQVHAQVQARQAHIARLTSDAAHLAEQSRENVRSALAATADAQGMVGKLLAVAEQVLTTIHRYLELSARGRHALVGVVPPDVLAAAPMPPVGALEASEAVDLTGLHADIFRPGETGEFAVVPGEAPDDDPDGAGIGKITRLLPALPAAEPKLSPEEAASEVWRLLSDLGMSASTDERSALSMTHELGLLNHSINQAASEMAWVLQSLEVLRRSAEQIEHVATTSEPLADPTTDAGATPIQAPRPPARTRPLAGELLGSVTGDTTEEQGGPSHEPGTVSASELLAPLEATPAADAESAATTETERGPDGS